jgi:sterol 14-demethylase
MRKVVSDIPVPPTLSAPSKDGAYVVPKGHFVMSSPAVSQVDPRIWKNPIEWDPYRWSDPEDVAAEAFKTYTDENGEKVDYGFGAVSKGTESPYQPFGAGRHRCIGEQVSCCAHLSMCLDVDTLHSSHISNWAQSSRHSSARLRCGSTRRCPLTITTYVSTFFSRIPSLLTLRLLSQTMITVPKNPCDIRYRRRHFD